MSLTIPSTFPEQAAQRVSLYAEALAQAGVTPDKPLRFIAALTTGLPGEVIELALVDDQGRPLVRRARPATPITPGATRHHGLMNADLAHEPSLKEQYVAFQEMMTRADGTAPVIVAWPGDFLTQALTNSLPSYSMTPAIVDVQDLIERVNRDINPYQSYRPTLDGLRYTVEMPDTDSTSALKNVLALRAAVYRIMRRESATTPPPMRPRSA